MSAAATAPRIAVRFPFPGLRPFCEEEEHLFFGRELQVDAMLDKLASRRFLAVVGTSGTGKSSLLNCGLKPALNRGLMASAGASWCMVQIRPGARPIRSLACGFAAHPELFPPPPSGSSLPDLIEATLRLSAYGVVDIYTQANLDPDTSLLVVVDQFEELFRYSKLAGGDFQRPAAESIAFVRLLLEAVAQQVQPIYVVLAMRSDFLGDCAQFNGLPEAVSESQYLVPRMTRDERKLAIEGPTHVAQAEISPVLLNRLVNDAGENPDQLPVLQHALNRTWARWYNDWGAQGPITIAHYEMAGGMASALDAHAEKAFGELKTQRQQEICERMFKALTDRTTDLRGVRRPFKLGMLCEIVGASEPELIETMAPFRKQSRSFLVPDSSADIDSETVIDISHESLMRNWRRLKNWADQEAEEAREYRRLADRAVGNRDKGYGLMQDPDLQIALDFVARRNPTAAWSELYGGELETTRYYLGRSQNQRDEQRADRELDRRWQLRWQPVIAAAVAIGFLMVLYAFRDALLPRSELTKPDDFARAAKTGLPVLIALAKLAPLTALAAAIYFFASRIGEKTYKRFARPQILAALRDPTKRAAVTGQRKTEIAALPYASMGQRTLAFLIDVPVVAALDFLAMMLVFIVVFAIGMSESDPKVDFMAYSSWVLAPVLYHALTVGSRMRGTLGMRASHLCVADLDGARVGRWRAAWRELLKWITLPVYWPLIYMASKLFWKKVSFVRRRQWLPDIMSRTVVIRRPRRVHSPVPSVQNPVSSN